MKTEELVNRQAYLYKRASKRVRRAEYMVSVDQDTIWYLFKLESNKSFTTTIYMNYAEVEKYVIPMTKLWKVLYES
jgi:hypothetical protein